MQKFNDNDKNFYDFEYFFSTADWRIFSRAHGGRYGFLLPYLKLHISGMKILDVGCGSGFLTNYLATLGNIVTGTDNSEAAITISRDRYPSLEFIRCSAYDLPEKLLCGEFDLVTGFDLIEHLHHQADFLELARQCLRPGGKLLLTTDNMSCVGARNWFWKKILNLGMFLSRDGLEYKMIKRMEKNKFRHLNRRGYSKSHVGLLQPGGLKNLLESSRFKVIDFKFYSLYRVWPYDLLVKLVSKEKRYESMLFLAESVG